MYFWNDPRKCSGIILLCRAEDLGSIDLSEIPSHSTSRIARRIFEISIYRKFDFSSRFYSRRCRYASNIEGVLVTILGRIILLDKVRNELCIAETGVGWTVAFLPRSCRFKFFVYSAYFDDRVSGAGGPAGKSQGVVRVISATKTRGPERVWCRLWYRQQNGANVTASVTVAAKVKVRSCVWCQAWGTILSPRRVQPVRHGNRPLE